MNATNESSHDKITLNSILRNTRLRSPLNTVQNDYIASKTIRGFLQPHKISSIVHDPFQGSRDMNYVKK
jgi:hypothetical protein